MGNALIHIPCVPRGQKQFLLLSLRLASPSTEDTPFSTMPRSSSPPVKS